MSLPFSYPKPYGTDVLYLNMHAYCHIPFPYITGFDMKPIHRRIQTTRSHTSLCHYCNVDFVLFHNVICYIITMLSRIHVNTTCLLNITCTWVTTCMILGRLACTCDWLVVCTQFVY